MSRCMDEMTRIAAAAKCHRDKWARGWFWQRPYLCGRADGLLEAMRIIGDVSDEHLRRSNEEVDRLIEELPDE